MPKLKPGTIVPSVEEDRAISAAARADADAAPLTDAQWKKAKASARVGRPPKADCKEQIALRVDADVLAWYRAQGAGWQTRMNAVLRAFRDAAIA